jgi:zinc transport system ATP-binding protein
MRELNADSDRPSAIVLKDVSFAYRAMPVLEQVNVTVPRGECISIVGPNGGGKTTLLRLVLGLLQPDEGGVRVFGQTPRQARLRIGYMPQHTEHDPLFPVTVLDVVLTGCLGRPGLAGTLGWHGATDRRAAIEALDQVGMVDVAWRPLAALSGGQRQRVLIARALVSRPELLLLDEPTANVDMVGETQLLETLRRLGREMTVVMVSHDLAFVAEVVRRVVCVNRRVAVHPTSEVTPEVLRDLYDHDVRLVQHDRHLRP